jgi:hypothetical protein
MKIVSRFESHLLRVLQFILRRVPLEQALPVITGHWSQPECLSQSAVELIQDHLGKGCTLILARCGGWRRERFMRAEQAADGRLWDRTPAPELGLVFSKHPLRFLLWITAHNPTDEKTPRWTATESELTPADELFFYLTYAALRETDIAPLLRNRPGFIGNRLCRLVFAEDLEPWDTEHPVDFAPWISGLGACVLEALQPELIERWVASELNKGRTSDWNHLRNHGQRQDQVLEAFLAAVEKAGRRDLARFLLVAMAELIQPNVTAQQWVNTPAITGARLADRVETYRSALALVNRVDRFRQWEHTARTVGYFDEGYAASQLVKTDWERYGGDELAARAQRIIRELDPLSVGNQGNQGTGAGPTGPQPQTGM